MFEKILVPLDGSDSAEAAIPYATELAARAGGEVVLASISDASPEYTHLHQAYLDKTVARIQTDVSSRGCAPCRVSVRVGAGKPAEEIARLAGQDNVGLIVMSSQGVAGRGSYALGNIASKVLQSSRTPVMLIRRRPPAGSGPGPDIKRILLPLDTSPSGEAAVPAATEVARLLGAAIVLFHVEPLPRPWLIAPGVEFAYLPTTSLERQAKQLLSHMDYLERAAQAISGKGVAVSRDAAPGAPAATILEYARTNGIDLIALSTHGASGMAEFVYGGVTEKMLYGGDIPLLIVRPAKQATV